jgi:hypothetical protein
MHSTFRLKYPVSLKTALAVQMNDGEGSSSSEQESVGRADSGQSAVGKACTRHELLLIAPLYV